MSEYNFEIKHIKGKENQAVYVLNRISHEIHIKNISMYMTDLKNKIIATKNSDKQYLKTKKNYIKEIYRKKLNIMRCKGITYSRVEEKYMCQILVK
jgi:hypothetical protein